jgi:RNA polymerase sigma-70 factor (ECF subfamily)
MDATATSQTDPDAVLMVAVREGDEEAFHKLFQMHAARLVAYADRFFRNRAQSEEIVQEVFLRIWRARARYEPNAKFTTWMYTIASRACLNELRRAGRRRGEESLDEGRQVEDSAGPARPDRAMEAAQVRDAIQQSLAGMPDNQRSALVLTRFGGHSYAEAASLLGLSESAVKSLIFRATTAIRTALDEQSRADLALASETGGRGT